MYGLVNKAVEDLVCSRFGEETWETIKRKARVDLDAFVSMAQYPDEVTYNLVGAASEVLGLSPEEILQAFGEYWVLYTAKEGYGDLLRMSGKSLRDFLHNLDELHGRVGLSYPDLTPPSFRCAEGDNGSLLLHYYSTRPGLAPMVIGLLRGLGELYETPVTVSQLEHRDQGADHDVFLVNIAGS